jgi:hypothetical protein
MECKRSGDKAGISTAELKKKAGAAERPVSSIAPSAFQEGKIRKIKHRLYGRVAQNR